jgi:hypothetical protein
MRKKDIEKIPYLTLPQRSKRKIVKYVGVTAWKNIGNERHIILEVYKNERGCKDIPVVRYVANKKDWGVFFPESGTWTHQKIETSYYYDGFAWQQEPNKNWKERDKVNTLYSEKDLSRIKNFFKDVKVWNESQWWDYFEQHETKIKRDREHRKYQTRRQRLEQRTKDTPELPETEILEWAQRSLFKEKHFLYYKKKGRRATICCSKCGGVTEGAWKAGDSYESQFESHIEEPRDKARGKCPLCGAYGKYKPQGKVKGRETEIAYVFTANKYRERGAIIRYVQLEHSWFLNEMIGDKGDPEMFSAYEQYSGVEIAREYILPGKNIQRDFHKHDGYVGKDFWDDCNLHGMNNIRINEGAIYPGMMEELKGTCLQYSGIKEYVTAVGQINVIDYMERYYHFPQIEMLAKMGLIDVVSQMIKGYCGIIVDEKAKRPEDFLGINKNHVKDLIREKGNTEYLNALTWERRLGASWTAEQVKIISMVVDSMNKMEIALRYMTMEQLMNRIEKYSGVQIEGEGICSGELGRLRHITTMYLDYLEMRVQLGYDLSNSVFAYPRKLEAAHTKMVMEQNKNELDKRLEEVKIKYPKIKKAYRSLRKKYFYEDDNFIIRPARSAEEIVVEGRMLHHCVGGDGYLSKHNEGESTILMLRTKEDAEIPYVTVEISGETIKQWYGAYDKKPDEENMRKWLREYAERLKAEDTQNKEKIELMVAV